MLMKRLFLVLALAMLCSPFADGLHAAQDAADDPLLVKEKEISKQRMLQIYDAIQAFRKEHKDLPRFLSELYPKYITDTNVFLCPTSLRKGEDPVYSSYSDPNLRVQYFYEFIDKPMPGGFGGGPISIAEWKRLQMMVVGGEVPILRCSVYDPVLNVSFDGKFFESHTMWEQSLADKANPADLQLDSLHARLLKLMGNEIKPALAELEDLEARVDASLRKGQRTEAEQSGHLKELDDLLAKYKGQANEDVAQIAFLRGSLYLAINQSDKGVEALQQIQRDFPDSKQAKLADQRLTGIKMGEAARKIQDALSVDSTFPDFEVKDLDGQPLSIAGYKGKVVMVDFWATWCGPCVGEVPNVAKVYEKYHDRGFEIIGVSLDQDGAKDKLMSFTREHNMPWRQYFDGRNWNNDLAVKYGIRSIPAAYLLDGSGKIIAKGGDIRGEGLEPAVKKALGIN
jgi:thiol-disulfide isomerase/thioredoxin